MKQFNQLIFSVLLSFLIYSVGYGQNFGVTNNHINSSSPDNPDDLVIVHYDGENAGNSVGDGGTTFIGGARFRAEILSPYTGGELQAVQFFYSQDATGLAIMIYDAGTSTDPGALLLTQPLDLGSLTVGDWNEVALTTMIPISGNDLWVTLQVEDATGANYPFGVDAGPADPDGDFVNDAGTWDHLAGYGLNYNWNIRGVVETPTGGPEPEMSLIHTPGDLNVGIFNTGAIGTEQINATGPGITWKGEQGLYMGGVLFGDAATASVNGVFGSFTSGGGPVINDLRNVESNFAGGFTSDANFDQISTAVLYDSAAPVPYNTEIVQKTYSNTGDDFVFIRYGIINRSGADITDGYSAIALDWDIGAYATNSGGYALNNHLVYQYDTGPTSSYYFGVIALTDVGGRRATPESAFGPPFSDARLDIYSWITSMSDTTFADGDFRSYISSGPMNYTVDDTVWTTYAIVAGDDLTQITDNGFNASVKAYNLGWTQMVVPVELSSFTANVNSDGQVVLNWSTATEINNRMFEIQRKDANNEYATVGFINGSGTTTEPKEYSFVDKNVNNGTYTYRLKQLDFDGKVSYSNTVDVNVSGPRTFNLAQNYPNPFNPTTTITYSVPQAGKVKLAIYNLLGQEVAVLVNGVVSEGSHQVEFNAKSLPSGAYFYKLQGENSVSVKKMLLLK